MATAFGDKSNDHEFVIGSTKTALKLVRDEKNGRPLYAVSEKIPIYRDPLLFTQSDWTGGHRQRDFLDRSRYFEGSGIDTFQDGRIILGPEIQQVGTSSSHLTEPPVKFLWFNAIGKWMVATTTKIYEYDGTNFVLRKTFTGETITDISEVNGILYVSLGTANRDTYYTTGMDSGAATYGSTFWNAQTFTPTTSHTVVHLRVPLCTLGTPPATYMFAIRATTDGKPSGSNLCSGTLTSSTVTTAHPSYTWVEISLGAGTALTASTVYAIVMYTASGDSNNNLVWGYDQTTPLYTGGSRVYSENAGVDWTIDTARDFGFEEWGSGAAKYYYTSDGTNYFQTNLSDGYAEKIRGFPNPDGTATVLRKYKKPNEVSNTTDGRTTQDGGVAWSNPAYVGDTSTDITNMFLSNDKILIAKENNLFYYDTNGGIHPLMNDIEKMFSANNFKYEAEWQGSTYFSLIQSIKELASDTLDSMSPTQEALDIGLPGTCVGIVGDKEFLYVAIELPSSGGVIIYKGRESWIPDKGLRWEWCPWVNLGDVNCDTIAICHHSDTDRRLWFGYGNYAGYVTILDNPTATSSGAKFAATGWIRMSYEYGTDPYWDMIFHTVITETLTCAAGQTVTPKYRKDTDSGNGTALTAAITTNGVVNTKLTAVINCKKIQFELHLATNDDSKTPQVLFFQACGVEKPETLKTYEATYEVGSTPSVTSKTIRDFLRGGRTTTSFVKFADLRWGESTDSTTYHWVSFEPGYPQEVPLANERRRKPELGIKVRMKEIPFTVS